MPRAGLAESSLQLVRAAVTDQDTVARYRSKIRVVAGSPCAWWTSAVSGRGHGRFWVGTIDGRDVVMIAHRFGWAVRYGVEALDQVPVLGHRCDNPLCQWIGPGHVEASSSWRNRQEWVMRRHTIGAPLRDARGARGRSRALRDAVRSEPSAVSLTEAIEAGMAVDAAQLPLWGEAVVLDLDEEGQQDTVAADRGGQFVEVAEVPARVLASADHADRREECRQARRSGGGGHCGSPLVRLSVTATATR